MIAPKNIAIKLTAKAETILKKGHPWIFSNSIVKIQDNAHTGDVAIVFSQSENKLIGVGLVDIESPIRIKILSANKAIKIDKSFFENRFKDAFDKRKPHLDKGITTAYRLIYGESDRLPSMIIDVYNEFVVVKLYSGIWLPYFELIKEAIISLLHPSAIVLRLGRNVAKDNESLEESSIVFGVLDNPNITFKEYDVLFSANLIEGHKTGYFLDHRFNRYQVGLMSKGKSVLDVFSYTGGFSVHALVGGAKTVTSIDISGQALEVAEQNAALNHFNGTHIIVQGDAFDILKQMVIDKKQFDIVVIDPPSFAIQKNHIESALKQYKKLAKLGVSLCKKGGVLVLASCSSRISEDDFLATHQEVFKRLRIHPLIIQKTNHDWDHPIEIPEMGYLKTVYYQM
ncbi:MAG TPA: class I SAM-dependent rRNA methyltransferase [Edaphocola sp.]|nr:class I SAM-dependent rRNA methyltransferase [Edaphocola sp.]